MAEDTRRRKARAGPPKGWSGPWLEHLGSTEHGSFDPVAVRGSLLIGSDEAALCQEQPVEDRRLVLLGSTVERVHCVISAQDGGQCVFQQRGGTSTLNGTRIPCNFTVPLPDGARLILGNDHLLRFHNPPQDLAAAAVGTVRTSADQGAAGAIPGTMEAAAALASAAMADGTAAAAEALLWDHNPALLDGREEQSRDAGGEVRTRLVGGTGELLDTFVPRATRAQLRMIRDAHLHEESAEQFIERLGQRAHARRRAALLTLPAGQDSGHSAAHVAAASGSLGVLHGIALVSSTQPPKHWEMAPLTLSDCLLRPAADGSTALHAAVEALVNCAHAWAGAGASPLPDDAASLGKLSLEGGAVGSEGEDSECSSASDHPEAEGMEVGGVEANARVPPRAELQRMPALALRTLAERVGLPHTQQHALQTRGDYVDWLEDYRGRRRRARARRKFERSQRELLGELLSAAAHGWAGVPGARPHRVERADLCAELRRCDAEGRAPLHIAAAAGHSDAVRALLAAELLVEGAQVVRNPFQWPPAGVAANSDGVPSKAGSLARTRHRRRGMDGSILSESGVSVPPGEEAEPDEPGAPVTDEAQWRLVQADDRVARDERLQGYPWAGHPYLLYVQYTVEGLTQNPPDDRTYEEQVRLGSAGQVADINGERVHCGEIGLWVDQGCLWKALNGRARSGTRDLSGRVTELRWDKRSRRLRDQLGGGLCIPAGEPGEWVLTVARLLCAACRLPHNIPPRRGVGTIVKLLPPPGGWERRAQLTAVRRRIDNATAAFRRAEAAVQDAVEKKRAGRHCDMMKEDLEERQRELRRLRGLHDGVRSSEWPFLARVRWDSNPDGEGEILRIGKDGCFDVVPAEGWATLETRSEVPAPHHYRVSSSTGATAAWLAARGGHGEALQLLLDVGADVDAAAGLTASRLEQLAAQRRRSTGARGRKKYREQNDLSTTPLFAACEEASRVAGVRSLQHYDVVRRLLAAGADASRTCGGMSAHDACHIYNRDPCLAALLIPPRCAEAERMIETSFSDIYRVKRNVWQAKAGKDDLVVHIPTSASPRHWGLTWDEGDGERKGCFLAQVRKGSVAERCGMEWFVRHELHDVNGIRVRTRAGFERAAHEAKRGGVTLTFADSPEALSEQLRCPHCHRLQPRAITVRHPVEGKLLCNSCGDASVGWKRMGPAGATTHERLIEEHHSLGDRWSAKADALSSWVDKQKGKLDEDDLDSLQEAQLERHERELRERRQVARSIHIRCWRLCQCGAAALRQVRRAIGELVLTPTGIANDAADPVDALRERLDKGIYLPSEPTASPAASPLPNGCSPRMGSGPSWVGTQTASPSHAQSMHTATATSALRTSRGDELETTELPASEESEADSSDSGSASEQGIEGTGTLSGGSPFAGSPRPASPQQRKDARRQGRWRRAAERLARMAVFGGYVPFDHVEQGMFFMLSAAVMGERKEKEGGGAGNEDPHRHPGHAVAGKAAEAAAACREPHRLARVLCVETDDRLELEWVQRPGAFVTVTRRQWDTRGRARAAPVALQVSQRPAPPHEHGAEGSTETGSSQAAPGAVHPDGRLGATEAAPYGDESSASPYTPASPRVKPAPLQHCTHFDVLGDFILKTAGSDGRHGRGVPSWWNRSGASIQHDTEQQGCSCWVLRDRSGEVVARSESAPGRPGGAMPQHTAHWLPPDGGSGPPLDILVKAKPVGWQEQGSPGRVPVQGALEDALNSNLPPGERGRRLRRLFLEDHAFLDSVSRFGMELSDVELDAVVRCVSARCCLALHHLLLDCLSLPLATGPGNDDTAANEHEGSDHTDGEHEPHAAAAGGDTGGSDKASEPSEAAEQEAARAAAQEHDAELERRWTDLVAPTRRDGTDGAFAAALKAGLLWGLQHSSRVGRGEADAADGSGGSPDCSSSSAPTSPSTDSADSGADAATFLSPRRAFPGVDKAAADGEGTTVAADPKHQDCADDAHCQGFRLGMTTRCNPRHPPPGRVEAGWGPAGDGGAQRLVPLQWQGAAPELHWPPALVEHREPHAAAAERREAARQKSSTAITFTDADGDLVRLAAAAGVENSAQHAVAVPDGWCRAYTACGAVGFVHLPVLGMPTDPGEAPWEVAVTAAHGAIGLLDEAPTESCLPRTAKPTTELWSTALELSAEQVGLLKVADPISHNGALGPLIMTPQQLLAPGPVSATAKGAPPVQASRGLGRAQLGSIAGQSASGARLRQLLGQLSAKPGPHSVELDPVLVLDPSARRCTASRKGAMLSISDGRDLRVSVPAAQRAAERQLLSALGTQGMRIAVAGGEWAVGQQAALRLIAPLCTAASGAELQCVVVRSRAAPEPFPAADWVPREPFSLCTLTEGAMHVGGLKRTVEFSATWSKTLQPRPRRRRRRPVSLEGTETGQLVLAPAGGPGGGCVVGRAHPEPDAVGRLATGLPPLLSGALLWRPYSGELIAAHSRAVVHVTSEEDRRKITDAVEAAAGVVDGSAAGRPFPISLWELRCQRRDGTIYVLPLPPPHPPEAEEGQGGSAVQAGRPGELKYEARDGRGQWRVVTPLAIHTDGCGATVRIEDTGGLSVRFTHSALRDLARAGIISSEAVFVAPATGVTGRVVPPGAAIATLAPAGSGTVQRVFNRDDVQHWLDENTAAEVELGTKGSWARLPLVSLHPRKQNTFFRRSTPSAGIALLPDRQLLERMDNLFTMAGVETEGFDTALGSVTYLENTAKDTPLWLLRQRTVAAERLRARLGADAPMPQCSQADIRVEIRDGRLFKCVSGGAMPWRLKLWGNLYCLALRIRTGDRREPLLRRQQPCWYQVPGEGEAQLAHERCIRWAKPRDGGPPLAVHVQAHSGCLGVGWASDGCSVEGLEAGRAASVSGVLRGMRCADKRASLPGARPGCASCTALPEEALYDFVFHVGCIASTEGGEPRWGLWNAEGDNIGLSLAPHHSIQPPSDADWERADYLTSASKGGARGPSQALAPEDRDCTAPEHCFELTQVTYDVTLGRVEDQFGRGGVVSPVAARGLRALALRCGVPTDLPARLPGAAGLPTCPLCKDDLSPPGAPRVYFRCPECLYSVCVPCGLGANPAIHALAAIAGQVASFACYFSASFGDTVVVLKGGGLTEGCDGAGGIVVGGTGPAGEGTRREALVWLPPEHAGDDAQRLLEAASRHIPVSSLYVSGAYIVDAEPMPWNGMPLHRTREARGQLYRVSVEVPLPVPAPGSAVALAMRTLGDLKTDAPGEVLLSGTPRWWKGAAPRECVRIRRIEGLAVASQGDLQQRLGAWVAKVAESEADKREQLLRLRESRKAEQAAAVSPKRARHVLRVEASDTADDMHFCRWDGSAEAVLGVTDGAVAVAPPGARASPFCRVRRWHRVGLLEQGLAEGGGPDTKAVATGERPRGQWCRVAVVTDHGPVLAYCEAKYLRYESLQRRIARLCKPREPPPSPAAAARQVALGGTESLAARFCCTAKLSQAETAVQSPMRRRESLSQGQGLLCARVREPGTRFCVVHKCQEDACRRRCHEGDGFCLKHGLASRGELHKYAVELITQLQSAPHWQDLCHEAEWIGRFAHSTHSEEQRVELKRRLQLELAKGHGCCGGCCVLQ